MAALRTSTPMPIPPLDLFDVQDCDDSGAREHVVDGADDGCVTTGAEREVA